jgi:UPF0755 protein
VSQGQKAGPRKRTRSRPPASRRVPSRSGATSERQPAAGLPARARRSRRSARWPLGILSLSFAAVIGLVVFFVLWARASGPGRGERRVIEIAPAAAPADVAAELARAGLVRHPRLFAWYLRVASPAVLPGRHLLRDDLGPRELAQRLSRSPARASVRVTIPEGFHHRQIAGRLAELEVCPAGDFERAVFDRALLDELGLRSPSAEGYLFPATYDFLVDSDPRQLVRALAAETRKRLARLEGKHPGARTALASALGFDEHDVLTLASIVERESGASAERPLVASVFLNRLKDPNFRPLRTLQSDPTAAYGCLIEPTLAPSCATFNGAVTPAMLRDAKNRYNTYRHAGLPPGPIANPGEAAITAVLAPAASDYLYFVATGGGRHTFSRTFEQHRAAVTGQPSP